MGRFNLWQLNGTPIDTHSHKHAKRFAIFAFSTAAGSAKLDDGKKKLVFAIVVAVGKG